MHLHRRIERYLRATRTSPTRFGREAANDPRLVFDLRNGREMRRKMRERVLAWLDRNEQKRAGR